MEPASQQPAQAQPPPTPNVQESNPVTVIGPQFCLPYQVELTCTRSKHWLTDSGYEITDSNGTIIFNTFVKQISLHKKRTLLGCDGKPIITISQKLASMHKTHFVYRGDENEMNKCGLLFTLRESSSTDKSVRTLNVFVGDIIKKDVPDFRVQGSWSRPSLIYAGKSSTIVAQTHQDTAFQGLFSGKDRFIVTIHSDIDYAFAVTLFLILADINHAAELTKKGVAIASTLVRVGGLAMKFM